VADYFPGHESFPLFESYKRLFAAVKNWLPSALNIPQIGIREIHPGVYVGMHTQISPAAKLIAPCWIGNHVHVGPEAIIGPESFVEDNVVIEAGAEIKHCLVEGSTFVGTGTFLADSLILGNLLINFRLGSFVKIRDAFLLSSLKEQSMGLRPFSYLTRCLAFATMGLTFPLVMPVLIRHYWKGTEAFTPHRAVRPFNERESSSARAVIYHELNQVSGWRRRWPQLWNICNGEFAWIGNRPLTPMEASRLFNDFERLWLTVPIGLISQADAEGCSEYFSDEGKAHASFYAARNGWKLRLEILWKSFRRSWLKGSPVTAWSENSPLRQKYDHFRKTALSGIVSKIF
jgi:carbonic anhydrase/acetyltransferase-like protein (isoleucine patch superfamily)